MVFSSNIFLFVFLPLVLVLNYLVFRRRRNLQNASLTVASLLFYAWGEPAFVLVLILSILIAWYCGLRIERNRTGAPGAKPGSPTPLVALLVCNLGILLVCKYLGFFVDNLNALFGATLAVPRIRLPIGISFFTFQAISYGVDIHRGKGGARRNPMDVALYISLFPQLIAGPIVRYETVSEQIASRIESLDLFHSGLVRFVMGLARKLIIANEMAVVADAAFSAGGSTVLFAWTGAVAYCFQIYYDFSGYSDMAIGLGRMFGFRFLENFDHPYASSSLSEFWRRWHISLGTWFRDYVYIPLGGNRVGGTKRRVFNLFVVWLLTGLWHGANWTFVLWGMLQFAVIALEKFASPGAGRPAGARVFGHVYTILVLIAGFVLFRSADLAQALAYLGRMAGIGVRGLSDPAGIRILRENAVLFAVAAVLSLPVLPGIARSLLNRNPGPAGGLGAVLVTLLFVACVSYLVKGGYNPFIYFNF